MKDIYLVMHPEARLQLDPNPITSVTTFDELRGKLSGIEDVMKASEQDINETDARLMQYLQEAN